MRVLLVLALVAVAICALAGARLYSHAARVAGLQSRVSAVTARCAGLNDQKHRLTVARRGASAAALDAAIDRCERELSDADLAWGAEAARSGWRALW